LLLCAKTITQLKIITAAKNNFFIYYNIKS